MSYLDVLYLLEIFTIRSKKEYDYGLVVRCRRFIFSIYKDFLPYARPILDFSEFKSLIDYIYQRSFSLPDDEFLFIRSFRKYVLKLTSI